MSAGASLDTIAHAVRDAATRAASLLMEGHRSRPTARTKSSAIDFVTEYDGRSEALLVEALAPLGIAIVGEEGGRQLEGDHGDERIFYIDPLDGTTNYLHGHPFFCISIGLLERGQPLHGLVHAPALGLVWEATRGKGALRNGEPCTVSTAASLEEALLGTGFPYDRHLSSDDNLTEFAALKKRVHGIRRGGSAAIDLAFVADGTLDGYWEHKLNPWDWAAGALLVQEAGGRLSRYDGSEFAVETAQRDAELVASNPGLHGPLREQLQAIRARGGQGPTPRP